MAKLDAIRAFTVVARHGNLRDAAVELGRTQSALSMALSQLEQSLGGSLFVSDRKRDLTDLGRFVRDMGGDMIREYDRALALIYGYANGEVGHLRIASVPSVAALILPDLLRDFMQLHSGARIDLTDSDSTNVREMIELGHADLGIAGPAAAGHALHEDLLFHDRLHVVCKAGSALAEKRSELNWSDLVGMPLIANETLSVVRADEARAIIDQSTLSVRNVSSLLAMVSSGMGITVLPGLATQSLEPTLIAMPLSGASTDRPISLLTNTTRSESPLSAAFQTFIQLRKPEFVQALALGP